MVTASAERDETNALIDIDNVSCVSDLVFITVVVLSHLAFYCKVLQLVLLIIHYDICSLLVSQRFWAKTYIYFDSKVLSHRYWVSLSLR